MCMWIYIFIVNYIKQLKLQRQLHRFLLSNSLPPMPLPSGIFLVCCHWTVLRGTTGNGLMELRSFPLVPDIKLQKCLEFLER